MTAPTTSGYYFLRASGKNPNATMPTPIYYFAETGHFRILAVTSPSLAVRIPWSRLGEDDQDMYDAWAPIPEDLTWTLL